MTLSELEEQLRQRDKQIEEQAARIKELERNIRELERLLAEKAQSKESKLPKEASNFSVNRYEQKQRMKPAGKWASDHVIRGFSVPFPPYYTSAVLGEAKQYSSMFLGTNLTGLA